MILLILTHSRVLKLEYKGIGYLLLLPLSDELPRSDEREELLRLLLLVLSEEERLSVFPLETLLRLELLWLELLRFGEVVVLLLLLRFVLSLLRFELLSVRPLSRLGRVVVLLPLLGLRLELEEPEFEDGRRFGVVSLLGLSPREGVEGRPEVDGLCSDSGFGLVVVPGRAGVSGRVGLSGRTDEFGRFPVLGLDGLLGLEVLPGLELCSGLEL